MLSYNHLLVPYQDPIKRSDLLECSLTDYEVRPNKRLHLLLNPRIPGYTSAPRMGHIIPDHTPRDNAAIFPAHIKEYKRGQRYRFIYRLERESIKMGY